MEIYDTNDAFDFGKLVLTKPSLISGGNYFSRCLVNNGALYIQPPKCKTKQGFNKAGKKFYCDLMFTNENENFIRWMENLENHCQKFIYRNREKWFDGEMEVHDIENYFTSPLKLYKSGKYYIARVNVNTVLNKPALKIYDEHETEVDMETINDNTNVMTILEIQGIKCSSRSFQIEFDLKQMMVLQPSNIFEKCIIKSTNPVVINKNNIIVVDEPVVEGHSDNADDSLNQEEVNEPLINDNVLSGIVLSDNVLSGVVPSEEEKTLEKFEEQQPLIESDVKKENDEQDALQATRNNIITEVIDVSPDGIEEIDFDLEELKNDETIQIKTRNDVYYEMYREARRKAKKARDLALSSYLEAKRIKNTYMLNDIEDSDDSDLETEEEENEEDEENSVEE
jgi:hypothetical protein